MKKAPSPTVRGMPAAIVVDGTFYSPGQVVAFKEGNRIRAGRLAEITQQQIETGLFRVDVVMRVGKRNGWRVKDPHLRAFRVALPDFIQATDDDVAGAIADESLLNAERGES